MTSNAADHCTRSKCSGRLRKVVEALCEAALKKTQEDCDKHSSDGSDSEQIDNPEDKRRRSPHQHPIAPKTTRRRGSKRVRDKLGKAEADTRTKTRASLPRTPTRAKAKTHKTKVTRRSKRLRNISDKNDSDSPPSPSPCRVPRKKNRVTRRSKRLLSCAGNQHMNKLSPQVADDDVDGFVIRSTATR